MRKYVLQSKIFLLIAMTLGVIGAVAGLVQGNSPIPKSIMIVPKDVNGTTQANALRITVNEVSDSGMNYSFLASSSGKYVSVYAIANTSLEEPHDLAQMNRLKSSVDAIASVDIAIGSNFADSCIFQFKRNMVFRMIINTLTNKIQQTSSY